MKALKIVGIVLGILLLLTGGGLAVGSVAVNKGQAAVDEAGQDGLCRPCRRDRAVC